MKASTACSLPSKILKASKAVSWSPPSFCTPQAMRSQTFKDGWAKTMTNGQIKFDESGLNTYAEPVMVQWQKKELVTVWPSKYAKGKLIQRNV